MSLRWFRRLDVYRCNWPVGLHEVITEVTKRGGVSLTFHVDSLHWQEDDECYLHSPVENIVKRFDSMTSCEMFISRLKKQWFFSVDDLKSRNYYFW